jgi:hypothetical protein
MNDWSIRVLEIRKNPSSATPDEIKRLGGNPAEQNPNEILTLTDDFFLGLAEKTEPQLISDMAKSTCAEYGE